MIDFTIFINDNSIEPFIDIRINEILLIKFDKKTYKFGSILYRWFLLN